MRKVKGFSYHPEKDRDVIEHIEKQANMSRYIWDLIRKDMHQNENQIEDLVKKYIEKYLGDLNTEKGV